MNKTVLWIVLALAVWGCAPATETAAQAPAAAEPAASHEPVQTDATEMDAVALKKRLDAGEDIYLLDVRNPDELVESGMISGAVNIPIDNLEARIAEVPKDKPIVTYCMRGGRASRAAEMLRKHGYTQEIEYGGITAWKEAGNPVVEPASE
jgi:adenylyltransferase/sulfurtransferase